MKVIGIIAEYNPFHNGHIYQIKKIKELYPDSIIIAIISTCFTERGDISIINKWNKTKICLENDIDIVLELPTAYAIQSADIFAKYAIKILNEFNIDYLAFGTETNKPHLFEKLATIQLNSTEYQNDVKTFLNEGLNYPTAMSKALEKYSKIKIDKPNDILALSYIKEIIDNKYNIKPLSIERSNNYHSLSSKGNIVSANQIRNDLLNKKRIDKYLPSNEIELLYKDISLNNLLPFLKYKVYESDSLDYAYLTEGIDKRIIKEINNSNTWEELTNKIKNKRHTYNRINRSLIHILLNIKENINEYQPYIKILGFNKKGRSYINKVKKQFKLPIYYKYKPNINKIYDIENKTTKIYSLIVKDEELISKEYKNNIIII